MTLNAHTVYTNAGGLDLFDQCNGAGSLFRLFYIVIIIIQLCIGRALLRQPEGFYDIILSQLLQEDGFAQGAVFVQGFIDNIPGEYFSLVAACHGGDMTGKELPQGIAVFYSSYK